MGQVTVSVNGRSYRLVCGDGEEARVRELAALLSSRVDTLVGQLGQAGEPRLLLMAGLLLADELLDTRAKLDEALAEAAEALRATLAVANPASPSAGDPVTAASPLSEPSRKPRIELPGKTLAAG